MRNTPNLRIEKYRLPHPVLGDSAPGANWGYFEINTLRGTLRILCDDGEEADSEGWEHVSVSLSNRTPTWNEMALVKDLFWKEEECVIQFHPPESVYVRHHPHVLHLWRHKKHSHPLPPQRLIGPKT